MKSVLGCDSPYWKRSTCRWAKKTTESTSFSRTITRIYLTLIHCCMVQRWARFSNKITTTNSNNNSSSNSRCHRRATATIKRQSFKVNFCPIWRLALMCLRHCHLVATTCRVCPSRSMVSDHHRKAITISHDQWWCHVINESHHNKVFLQLDFFNLHVFLLEN